MNRTLPGNLTIHEKIKIFQTNSANLTHEDLNEIKLYLLEYKDNLQQIQFFEGEIKNNKIVSCFSESYHEELIEHMKKKLNAAIVIIVVLSKQEILLNKNNKLCTIDFIKLSKFLLNTEHIDTERETIKGAISSNFLKLTKQLSPCL